MSLEGYQVDQARREKATLGLAVDKGTLQQAINEIQAYVRCRAEPFNPRTQGHRQPSSGLNVNERAVFIQATDLFALQLGPRSETMQSRKQPFGAKHENW